MRCTPLMFQHRELKLQPSFKLLVYFAWQFAVKFFALIYFNFKKLLSHQYFLESLRHCGLPGKEKMQISSSHIRLSSTENDNDVMLHFKAVLVPCVTVSLCWVLLHSLPLTQGEWNDRFCLSVPKWSEKKKNKWKHPWLEHSFLLAEIVGSNVT